MGGHRLITPGPRAETPARRAAPCTNPPARTPGCRSAPGARARPSGTPAIARRPLVSPARPPACHRLPAARRAGPRGSRCERRGCPVRLRFPSTGGLACGAPDAPSRGIGLPWSRSQLVKAAAVIGCPRKNPRPMSHPVTRSSELTASDSTPSATTLTPSLWARSTVVRTIVAKFALLTIGRTMDSSSLSSLMGQPPRLSSEAKPAPKSSSEIRTPLTETGTTRSASAQARCRTSACRSIWRVSSPISPSCSASGRNRLGRRGSELGVLPPGEQLGRHQPTGRQLDLELEVADHLPSTQRAGKLSAQPRRHVIGLEHHSLPSFGSIDTINYIM